MKRTERQHLKENELVHTIYAARDFLGPRKRQLTGIVVAIGLMAAALIGIVIVRQQMQSRGQDLLAEAMVALNARVVPAGTQGAPDDVPAAASLGATGTFSTEEAKLTAALPKLKAAADAYPDSEAGITARYHMAGALAALGRHKEAIEAFDDVARRAGTDSLYGRMAALGKADTQARSGQIDQAITAWKELASRDAAELPVDAILMQLARAYAEQGNTEEARKTYSQIVDQHPDSPYTPEARQELENLKG
jgi:TolA-binding protein